MFKQIEPAHIETRAKEEVQANFIIFGLLCAAIRITPYVIRKLSA